MRKKNPIDVLRIIVEFQKRILLNKPSQERMLDEIRMMHFKIKPLAGDISLLNFQDKNLIESLWNLGKLDEFYRGQQDKLNRNQQDIFFRFFEDLYDKIQEQLYKMHFKTPEDLSSASSALEMEIYKEESRKLN